jgi:hypothetical protein
MNCVNIRMHGARIKITVQGFSQFDHSPPFNADVKDEWS